jgi:tRNA(Leu) C34 or U34 (ribose-2'-O)-methylase TrmL
MLSLPEILKTLYGVEGAAGSAASIAVTNVWLQNTTDEATLEKTFREILAMIKNDLGNDVKESADNAPYTSAGLLNVSIASLGCCVKVTKNETLLELFWRDILLSVLDRNGDYLGLTPTVEATCQIIADNFFSTSLMSRILADCTLRFEREQTLREATISLQKWAGLVEEIFRHGNSGSSDLYRDQALALGEVLQKCLRCSVSVARVALRLFLREEMKCVINQEFKQDVWGVVLSNWSEGNAAKRGFAFTLLTHFFDFLGNIWQQPKCWDIVVDGLKDTDAAIAKRAYRILRQIVDAAAASPAWESNKEEGGHDMVKAAPKKRTRKKKKKNDMSNLSPLETWKLRFSLFGSIFECLDGVQSHLVEAVWPQFGQLSRIAKYENEQWPAPFMLCDHRFIGIITQKAFRNQNPAIKNWAVMAFIKNPPKKGQHWFVEPDIINFHLVEAIKSANFYRRFIDGIQKPFLEFLYSYVNDLKDDQSRVSFLKTYVKCTCKISKNDYPLVTQMEVFPYMVKKGLLVKGAIGTEEIEYFRQNFESKNLGSILTRSLLSKSSIAAIVSFSIPEEVSIDAIATFAVSVRGNFIDPGTPSHDSMKAWVGSSWLDQSSGSNMFVEQLAKVFANSVNIRSQTDSYVAREPVQGILGADKCAFLLSLVQHEEDHRRILEPVVSVLRTCYSRSYVPSDVLQRAFRLFVTVSASFSSKSGPGLSLIAKLIGASGVDEMLSYLEHDMERLLSHNVNSLGKPEDEVLPSMTALALGQLLKVSPGVKVRECAFKFISQAVSNIESLRAEARIEAMAVLDTASAHLLHPNRASTMDDFPEDYVVGIDEMILKICQTSCHVQKKSGRGSNFYASQWNLLSTLSMFFVGLGRENAAEISFALQDATVVALFDAATEALNSAANSHLGPVLETMVSLFPPWYNVMVREHGSSDALYEILAGVFKCAYCAFTEMDPNKIEISIIDSFVQLVFHETLSQNLELHRSSKEHAKQIRSYVKKLMVYMSGGRANQRIMHSLTKQMFRVFSMEGGGNIAGNYVKEIGQMVLYEEPLEEHLHEEERERIRNVHSGVLKHSILQAEVLVFLDHLKDKPDCKELLLDLSLHFINLNFQADWKMETYMPNSPVHGLKLRLWQCLCVLAQSITDQNCEAVLSVAFKIIDKNHLPSIRYYIEIFLARCLFVNPAVLIPKYMTPWFTEYNVRSPTIVSALYVLTYTVPYMISSGKYDELLFDIVLTVLPWMCSPSSQARVVTQYILSIVLAHLNNDNEQGKRVDIGDQSLIQKFQDYINNNREMKKMLKRQTKNLRKLDVSKVCTLEGVMAGQLNIWGNIFPEDILGVLKDTITNVNLEVSMEDQYRLTWLQATSFISQKPKDRKVRAAEAAEAFKDSMYGREDAEGGGNVRPFEFQRKILPWGNVDDLVEGELKTFAASEKLSRANNYTTRARQEIIVVATLVDKTPNLAGLARTCEIFGATKLVIPSKKYQDDELFSTISVTAEKWLPIEYVPEIELRDYLMSVRNRGYALVGLEQTSQSKTIQSYNFPRKVAILLGKEQEGIPVEYIDMLDECIEIPQFGIIRSLNVHVSGSILLWEYTRQGLVNKR